MFQRLARFVVGSRAPVAVAVNMPSKPSAHNTPLGRFFAPARESTLRSSLLAPRMESQNPVFQPKKGDRHRSSRCRGRSNRRKAQRLHKAKR
jgi:hypothetical protein